MNSGDYAWILRIIKFWKNHTFVVKPTPFFGHIVAKPTPFLGQIEPKCVHIEPILVQYVPIPDLYLLWVGRIKLSTKLISTIIRYLMFFKWSWITLFWGNFEPPKICLRKDFNFSHVWPSSCHSLETQLIFTGFACSESI